MGNKVRHNLRNDSQKELIKLLDSLCGRWSRWEIWSDFIVMVAISISNALGGTQVESREQTYLDRAKKYTEQELLVFAQMFAEVVVAMENNPNQDYLGELYMAMELGNNQGGQFFTPYHICEFMAKITTVDIDARIEEQGWVSVNDSCCGAGALLIAFANELKSPEYNVNYQTQCFFVAQDIDLLAGLMCYIQLSLLGCAGYVVIDNSLTRPARAIDKRGLIPVDGANVWYTPMYCTEVWHWRRVIASIATTTFRQDALEKPPTELPQAQEFEEQPTG